MVSHLAYVSPFGRRLNPLVLLPPTFQTQAHFGKADERIVNVPNYGLSSALLRYYEGARFMMKPLRN